MSVFNRKSVDDRHEQIKKKVCIFKHAGVDSAEEVILFHLSSFLTLINVLLKCRSCKTSIKEEKKNHISVYLICRVM